MPDEHACCPRLLPVLCLLMVPASCPAPSGPAPGQLPPALAPGRLPWPPAGAAGPQGDGGKEAGGRCKVGGGGGAWRCGGALRWGLSRACEAGSARCVRGARPGVLPSARVGVGVPPMARAQMQCSALGAAGGAERLGELGGGTCGIMSHDHHGRYRERVQTGCLPGPPAWPAPPCPPQPHLPLTLGLWPPTPCTSARHAGGCCGPSTTRRRWRRPAPTARCGCLPRWARARHHRPLPPSASAARLS